jgi:DNA processing protein
VDPFLLVAAAEGFQEAPVAALLDPAVRPEHWLAECDDERLPPRVRRRLGDREGLRRSAAALQAAATAAGLDLLTPDDARYPAQLRDTPLRPLVLFARGEVEATARVPSVTVVGSRTPTPYGLAAAADFAAALARAAVVTWSGLARGIDAIAHRACCDRGQPTVAVLAGGLDRIYPPEHGALAAQIVAAGGCLLSELPPGRPPRRGHFLRRNRLLAAGSQAVLVIEAGATSGTLSTARCAAECGRGVFAVPGPYQSERSRGCHRLIADGAAIACDPGELLRELGVMPGSHRALPLQGSADAEAILACLRTGPRPRDLVMRESGLPPETFLPALFALERCGAVLTLPGDLLAASR